MEFKQLQSFVTVVQQKSFTKAATQLFLSQPTISLHITQLEEELHTKLILRTTKSISITPKGQELYGYAMNILELKQRMIQSCSIESKRIIHLGASTIPSAYILPQLLPEFGKLHEDIYFVMHQNDSQGIIDGLKDGLFNIGFIGMSCDDEELVCQPFCEDRLVLITPVTEHYLALKTLYENALANDSSDKTDKCDKRETQNLVQILAQLLAEPLILREKGSGSEKLAEKFLATSGVSEDKLHVVARVNDQEAIKNLVAGGLGISLISEKAAQNFLLEKRILAFELPASLAVRKLYLIYRKNYLLPTYVQEFLRFITKQKGR
ncbi:MAG: LysR family transcriptional regulator [Phascolarctobacterium sp.]|nr:LysR family transcriptional regulator [Phascolarctobacterium sp.]